jgi:hypothetical protein
MVSMIDQFGTRRKMMPEFGTQEKALGASPVFRVVPGVSTATLADQLPRRERWILLLLDGRRTVADLARLTQRSELDVAATLARFLQWGSIEPVSREQFRTITDGRDAGSV